MSLLAETLVDEWLNRQGFLTMRGIRDRGVDEIDLLGVKPQRTGGLEALHVEVQISFRPVGYITQLCKAERTRTGRVGSSAILRTPKVLQESVDEWVHKKFGSPKKVNLRKKVWPNLSWKKVFVYGVVRDGRELALIKNAGIEIVSFKTVLQSLNVKEGFTGASGTDISDIIDYFASPTGPTARAPEQSSLDSPLAPLSEVSDKLDSRESRFTWGEGTGIEIVQLGDGESFNLDETLDKSDE